MDRSRRGFGVDRRLRGLGAGAAAGVLLWLTTGAGPAAAEPPLDLGSQVTDRADALSPAEEDQVHRALDRLSQERDIDLHVVFVDTFDGSLGPAWATATFGASGLGYGDAVLAVAVEERSYGYHEDTSVSTDWASEIATGQVEPHLRDEAWTDAALAAAQGYGQDDEPFPWGFFGGVWAVVLTAVGAPWAFIWRAALRGRRETEAELIEQRAGLARDVVDLEELVGTARAEADYAAADLGTHESERLRELAQRATQVIGSTASALKHTPRERAPWAPKKAELAKWRKRIQRRQGTTRSARKDLEAGIGRVQAARALLENPGTLTALAERVTELQTRCADTRDLLGSTRGRHPAWLADELLTLLDKADACARAAAKQVEHAQTLLDQGEPAEAGVWHHQAREDFRDGEGLLARVADPDRVAQEALAVLQPLREKLSDLVERSQEERDHHDDYVDDAKKVDREQDWATRSPAPLDEAIDAARTLLAAPPRTAVSPEQQEREITAAHRRLDRAVAPYVSLAQALAAYRAARASSSSSSSGGGGGGGGGGGSSSSGGGRF